MAILSTAELGARPPPTPEQHAAADPACSVWVSASAGTGKTRVLANRMLRLLLAGNDPGQILCLTYTKAGAAEMASRVQDDLSRFAVLDDATLALELERLQGTPPLAADLGHARTLLARVLDLPAGLRIMTIHSLCQSLLHRFPIEAGITPHFELIEPRAAADLLRQASDRVLARAPHQPALRDAVATVAVALGDSTLKEALAELNGKRHRLAALIARHGGIDGLIDRVHQALDVSPGVTLADLRHEACNDSAIDQAGLAEAAGALLAGKSSDVTRGSRIAAWIEAAVERRGALLDDYLGVFITGKGTPQKTLATKQVQDPHPAIGDVLATEQDRMLRVAARLQAATVAARSAALLRLGGAIIETYEKIKAKQAALDYDDLIQRTRALLAQDDIVPWVRYKLDQQIDHLLIDESQDTSPDQWAIAEGLIAEFFSGEGGREVARTLFVVGDEKQSIFSFQGADVLTFQEKRRALAARAEAARLAWREAPLDRSFRSAPAVLAAVDAVFAEPAVRAGVVGESETIAHLAFKDEAPGLVEVWPLIEGEPAARPEPWALPDDRPPPDRAERRLAQAMVAEIRRWLNDGTRLMGEDRPIRASDIMILLPRRGVLQDLLIRQMRRDHVPVAGADRLALTEDLAVMDLMALGDALLLPEDDLTFATVMRSPLFGLDEADLFTLAHDRGELSLHRRLLLMQAEKPSFAAAAARFQELLAAADFTPPFEFYATLLAEGGGRKQLLARLGLAAAEPIEAFLAQALAFEQGHPPSLQGFLHWLRADDSAMKRDADRPRDEVRVLTVHGAKGLEAPIVFLADCTYVSDLRKERLLWLEDGLPLWKMPKAAQDPVSAAAQALAECRRDEEYRRLLYVAMTRAAERLIVTGCKPARGDREDGGEQTERTGRRSWYELITAGMERLPGVQRPRLDFGVCAGEGWRYLDGGGKAPEPAQSELPLGPAAPPGRPVPDWLKAPLAAEAAPAPLRPSREPEDDAPPAASPLDGAGEQRRFGRGRLIHRLLQMLPDHPPAARAALLRRHLARPGHRLELGEQQVIAAGIMTILETPAFAPLFAPGSRAEVPLVGEIGGRRISGQVDRLALLEDRVLVVDYKTNRPPPLDASAVPLAYRRQLAAYRALLRAIYPGHRIGCALLWTEGPNLMFLDDDLLDPLDPGRPGTPVRP
jgi:ATP-dependent helicase/nuclease subunit A